MEIKDRLLKIIKQKNLSQAEFAKILGIQKSNLSHVLKGRNEPSCSFLKKMMTVFPEVNFEWLLLGKGKAFIQLEQAKNNSIAAELSDIFLDTEKASVSENTPSIAKEVQNKPDVSYMPTTKTENNPVTIENTAKASTQEMPPEQQKQQQQSLFSATTKEEELPSPTPMFTKENEKKEQADITEKPAINTNITNANTDGQQNIGLQNNSDIIFSSLTQANKSIERIIIFYSDKSFGMYTAE